MPIVQIIHKSLVIFLLLGGTFALVLGVGLLLRADWCMRLNEAMSRWISTREALRPLEVPRDTQRVLYRHHRVLGLLV
ncbi:MAG: hypothetical protein ACREUO_00660, partial [Burkholderiales bacterium]